MNYSKSTLTRLTLLVCIFLSACAQQKPSLNLAEWMQEIPDQAKFIDEDYFVWGGSMVEGDDGKYHLYYSRWKRELGHNAWVTHSEIAHAIADEPTGPYVHKSLVFAPRGAEYWDGLCTHNPTVHKFNGKYYLYYMGNTGDGIAKKSLNWVHRNNQRIGVAIADSPHGPWRRADVPLLSVSAEFSAADSLLVSNPSVTSMADGRYLMIYKAVTKDGKMPFGGKVVHLAAIADSPTGPFVKQNQPLFVHEGEKFPAEDPFIWRQGKDYWAIVKDFNGVFTGAGQSLALFESSDGLDWKPSANPLVSKLELQWKNSGTQKVLHLERPQLWLKDGEPAALFCAVDESREHSYNVQIPLVKP